MFKKIFIILVAVFIFVQYIDTSYSAATDSGSSDNYLTNTKDAEKFILKAKKLEEKNKIERATKLYSKALEKLQKAYISDKKS